MAKPLVHEAELWIIIPCLLGIRLLKKFPSVSNLQ